MQLDFHYYAIHKLARLAGYTPKAAELIAYASQYVDDATESEPIQIGPDYVFDPVRTAHIGLEAFSWDVQRKVYMPFHFLPPRTRVGSRWFSYVTRRATTPGQGEIADGLALDIASDQNTRERLIRLGVALHSIADTFSHCGFSGRQHAENEVGELHFRVFSDEPDAMRWEKKPWKQLAARVAVPQIGHAEAFHAPDQTHLAWGYVNSRGKAVVRENWMTSLEAAEHVYLVLRQALGVEARANVSLQAEHRTAHTIIRALLQESEPLKAKCERWRSWTKAPEYDKTKWRAAALEGNPKWDGFKRQRLARHLGKAVPKKGFAGSNWAKFHRAARRQRHLVLNWIS